MNDISRRARQCIVTFGLAHRTLAPIDAIGVDEIQYAKGHKYLTVVYQIEPAHDAPALDRQGKND